MRAKKNLKFQRLCSYQVNKANNLKCDQTITLSNFYASKDYPDKLRRVKFYDKENEKNIVVLTNIFTLPAATIADLFKCRWKIEIFFRWIKQHLRIKAFYGTSFNAVKTQIWIAITTYVLIAIVKKRLNLNVSLYTFLQILSVNMFERVDILQLVTNTACEKIETRFSNQLNLFD